METYFCIDCNIELTGTESSECRMCGEALCDMCDIEKDGHCQKCFKANEKTIIENYLSDKNSL